MSVGLGPLDEFTVRDQWAEITRRAEDRLDVVAAVTPDDPGRRGRTGKAVAAALTAAALVAAGFVAARATSDGHKNVPAGRPPPIVTWSVTAPVPVPSPNPGARPLLAAANGVVFAAYGGSDQMVAVDAGGAAHPVVIDGEIAAVTGAADERGVAFGVVLTREGQLIEVDSLGSHEVLAELGSLRSAVPQLAVAAGQVFVAGTPRGGLVAVDRAREGGIRVVDDLEPTLIEGDGRVLWALDQTTGRLTRLDATTLRPEDTTRVPNITAMAAANRHLYMLRPETQTLISVDADLEEATLGRIDPSSNSISAARGALWVEGSGVLTAHSAETGRLIGAVAVASRWDSELGTDGSSTWVLTAGDDLRRLVPNR